MRDSPVFTADAMVISRRNLGEADRSLTLFTRQYGKIRVLARGLRKVSSKRAPHLEIFSRCIVTIHKGKGMDTLTEVSPVENFEAIRTDLKRVGAAYYLCEVVSGLLPDTQPHEDVFMLLVSAFTTLANVNIDRVGLLRQRFTAALLRILGYLEQGKKPPGENLDAYVEQLLERKLKTVKIADQLK